MTRTVVLVGTKGGSGATTLARELALLVAQHRTCVLVDADLSGRRSHAILFDLAESLDAERGPGEPGVAKAPKHALVELARSYEDGFLVAPEAVEKILTRLPQDATYVVDAPQPLAAAVRPFTRQALRFVLVTEPTLLGVAGGWIAVANLLHAGVPRDRIAIVVNHRDGGEELRRSEIEAALDGEFWLDVPNRHDRGFARAIETLATRVAELPPADPIAALAPAGAPVGDRRAVHRTAKATFESGPPRAAADARYDAIKSELTATILGRLNFAAAARMHTDAQKMAEFRAQVDEIASELIAGRQDLTSAEEAFRMKAEIIEESLGYGPLESLLADTTITEIMVNGANDVYIEREGHVTKTGKRFIDDNQVRLVIERIIAPLGRRIDEASPMVDARLPDGSRVNAIIEPLAIDGPVLTIRRFGAHRLTVEELLALDSMTPAIAAFLKAAVEARLNLIISGGTGSGKTTLLGALSTFIPSTDRIITIEDAAELSLAQPHVVRLESRPANLEGRGEVRIRDLVRNALRMRPDRIIVGECRSGEALDMLQAMNTGHDGSLTTVHANSPRDSLLRVETMVLMAGFDLPVRAIREQISSAIDMVVQVARLRDGSRRIVSVSEVVGMEGDTVTMQEIIRFERHGVDEQGKVIGAFEPTGVQPTCLGRFAEHGIPFDESLLAVAPPLKRASWRST